MTFSTHVSGNTLDAVITKYRYSNNPIISNVRVIEETGTKSDHFLITFMSIQATISHMPVYYQYIIITCLLSVYKLLSVTCLQKPAAAWKNCVLLGSFCIYLRTICTRHYSELCDPSKFTNLEHAISLYNIVLTFLLDKHAPIKTKQHENQTIKSK